ncbi:MAG: hypothetical protein JSS87_10735 [Acidobacteria bacterium]|nr:hypothetical protein [Acidobacteriota bacterium]
MFVLSLLALMLLQSAPATQSAPPSDQQEPPRGKVLFERHAEPVPEIPPASPALHTRSVPAEPTLPDTLRDSFVITAYDLDLHLNYATGEATIRARISVRNNSGEAAARIPLQVTSSMHWQSARVHTASGSSAIPYEEHALITDADHTGRVSEIWLTPSKPVAAGTSINLDLFYEGPLVENAARLLAVGAPESQASASDWDGFNSAAPASGVRGFGNVLWYPVVHRPLHLGKGNELFKAIAEERIAVQDIPFHLRLTVESPTPLTDAFFCGERQPLQPLAVTEKVSNEVDEKLPITGIPTLFTAEWRFAHIGQRAPSLFIASVKASTASSGLMEAYTERPETLASYNAAAVAVRPVMEAWLGARPLAKITLLDLGARSALPFQDGTLIVLPMHIEDQDRFAPVMTEWLTYAWFRAPETWMTSGLAAFMQRLWAERELRGEDKRIVTQKETALALAIYESTKPEGSGLTSSSSVVSERPPLTRCADPICYRTKGAAVFRMLRFLVGEDPLQQALQAFRDTNGTSQQFQSLLERTSGKDLGWFFDDWIYHDRGLPDLSIVGVSPRAVSGTTSSVIGSGAQTTSPDAQRARTRGGWLVAVEVQNDGEATAEVPVTLRGDQFSTTEPLRILPHSHATIRILVPAEPTELQVNDGTVPELRADTHIRTLQSKKQ